MLTANLLTKDVSKKGKVALIAVGPSKDPNELAVPIEKRFDHELDTSVKSIEQESSM